MKKIISLILVLLTVVSCLFVPISAAGVNDYPLDKTTVEEDFKSANFDTERYISNLENPNAPSIVFTREYGYTGNSLTHFYIYVYVSSEKYEAYPKLVYDELIIEAANNYDKNGSPISYYTYNAYYVDRSDDKRFYKYCIVSLDEFDFEGGRLYTFRNFTVQPSSVQYRFDNPYEGDPSGAGDKIYREELARYRSNVNQSATSNRSFFYEGYDSSGTVECEVFQDNVIDIETKPTVYRTLSSDKVHDKGVGYSYDIFSVYFSIPNVYLEKYDYLRAISYKHYEQLWNAVVVSQDRIYSQVSSMLDVDFSSGFNKNYPEIYANFEDAVMGMSGLHSYSYAINPEYSSFNPPVVDRTLLNVYQVEDWRDDDIFISGNNVTGFFDYKETGEKSDWFLDTIPIDKTFKIESFTGNDPNFQTWILSKLYGYGGKYETQLSDVVPIVTYQDASAFSGYIEGSNDEIYANEHLVNKRDIPDFINTVRTSTSKGESVVLFRFAVRDYYSRPCVVLEQDFFELADKNGFYARGTAFNKFNVISLTFRKGNQDFVVLVNNDPIDINGGVTGPNDTLGEDLKESVSNGLGGLFDGLKDAYKGLADEVGGLFRTIGIILVCIVILFAVILLSKLYQKSLKNEKNKNDKYKKE